MAYTARPDRAARAAGVVAHHRLLLLRRALHDAHLLQWNLQCVRHDLREGRLVRVALRLRDRVDGDHAVAADLYLDVVLGRVAGAAVLDDGGDADAAKFSFLLRFRAALAVPLPVGKLERLVEQARHVGIFVGAAGLRGVGKRIGRYEIAPAQLRGIR